MLSIRNAEPGDIGLIRDLTFRVWPQTYASIISQQQIEFMLDMMYSKASLQKQMENGCRFIILYNVDEPTGFASFGEISPGVIKLHKLYILPAMQGQGAGQFMMEHIIKDIRQQGAVSLQLQVNRNNPAKKFYERLGFEVIKEADFDIGGGYFMNDFVMEKIFKS